MAQATYYPRVSELLRQADLITDGGFVVEVWGKGVAHNEVLRVKKAGWKREIAGSGPSASDANGVAAAADVGSDEPEARGVEVYFESGGTGLWALNCEIWPRLGKGGKRTVGGKGESPAQALLSLKGELTARIRERGQEEQWGQAYGANLKRAREDGRHPSSVIVFTFALSLAEKHVAEQFVERVLRVIEGTAGVIDEVLAQAEN